MPPWLRYLWDAYRDISSSRAGGFSGPQAITFAEIIAWQQAMAFKLRPWEVQAIKILDAEFLNSYYEAQERKSKQQKRQ